MKPLKTWTKSSLVIDILPNARHTPRGQDPPIAGPERSAVFEFEGLPMLGSLEAELDLKKAKNCYHPIPCGLHALIPVTLTSM